MKMNSIIPPRIEAREAARAEIYHRISGQYEEHRRHAGVWGRIILAWRIRKEVAAELKRRFPPYAFYAN